MKPLFFIAKRYFVFKKSTHIVNVISWISITSIAVCTAALIIIASVFNGIDGLIKSMYNNYSPALKITPQKGKIITLNDTLKNYLENKNHFSNVSYTVALDALIQSNQAQLICKLQGIDSNFQNKKFKSLFLRNGAYLYPEYADKSAVLLSTVMARSLGIDVEMGLGEVSLYTTPVFLQSMQLEQELKTSYCLTVGTYQIHKDVDMQYCFAPLLLVQNLSGLNANQFTSIDVFVDSIKQNNLPSIKKMIQQLAPSQSLLIENKLEQNKNLFAILSSEKLIIYLILSFVIFIAAFNIAGTINLLMMEKRKQIYLLQTFGYSFLQVKKIFLYCGFLYGILGLVGGLLLGSLICLLQQHFHLIPIQGDFVIHYFPVEFRATDFFIISGIALCITFFASQYAIWKLRKQFKVKIQLQQIN